MTEDIQVDDEGEAATVPANFNAAIALVRERGLRGLWIRDDFLNKRADPPTLDLSALHELPDLRSFGISEGIDPRRVLEFEGLYSLRGLEKLALYKYPSLDLGRFEQLEVLMVRDSPKLRGLGELSKLRELWITGMRDGDLSMLANSTGLANLTLIRAKAEALVGLEQLASLTALDLTHCGKLAQIAPLPPKLRTLNIERCHKLGSLSFLCNNASIEALYATTIDDLEFVPSMARLDYLGFNKLGDGDLGPVLRSHSLRKINFERHRSYNHSPAEIREMLERRSV